MKPFMGRDDAKVIQGVALVLIFGCHFLTNYYFTEENRLLYKWCGLAINDLALELHIQKAAQLCRALFAFVSGYAIYINRDKYRRIKYCVGRVCRLLANYWIILFLLYFAGWIFDEPMPDKTTFFYNLFGCGINSDFVCPVFAGYISFYVALILLAPVWVRLFNYHFIIEIIEAMLLKMMFVNFVAFYIKSPLLYAGPNAVLTTYLGG